MVNINTNVTFHTAQTPYHYTVENIPLRELLDNDIALADALNGFLKGNLKAPVDRSNFTELQPYLGRAKIGSNEFQSVFVRPGKFMARINSPAESHTGLYEDIPGLSSVDAVKNLASQVKSRSVSGAGRTAVVEFRERTGGGDQYAIIEPWDVADWDTNPGSIARIDLIYVRAYPAVDQNGNSIATAPDIGVLKGAGILSTSNTKSNQTDRFTNALQTKAHMAADSSDDNIFGIDAGDSESAITSQGSIPSPEDLINSSEVSINNAEALTNRNYMFIPVAYVVVPATYTSTTDTIASTYLSDIRPMMRTTELTLDERQAIVFADPRPDINNPFATIEYVKDSITSIKLPPGKKGDPGPPGKSVGQTDIIILGQGVIRGGIDYGPEALIPAAKSFYDKWAGNPDWDELPAKYTWKVALTHLPVLAQGTKAGGSYIWESDDYIHSKKTISLSLPRPEYSHYFVECEYMYSVPLRSGGQPGYPKNTTKTSYDFDVGLSVSYDVNQFTIVTKARSWFGMGWKPALNQLGYRNSIHGGYGLNVGTDHLPLSYLTGTTQGEKVDPRYVNTRAFNSQKAIDGYIHLLPTVRYTVYAVKSTFLTTGGALIQTVK